MSLMILLEKFILSNVSQTYLAMELFSCSTLLILPKTVYEWQYSVKKDKNKTNKKTPSEDLKLRSSKNNDLHLLKDHGLYLSFLMHKMK